MTTRRRATAVVIGLALTLAACASDAPMDTLEPEGPIARKIDNLINPVFIVAGIIFLLVEGAAVFFVIRYRHRPGRADPAQIHGNTRLEVLWTLIPALILFAVAIPTIRTIFDLSRTPENPLNVTVVGHQFWWEYRYDDLGVVTANELHMPVGQPVELTLESDDVIHSFWVPPLGGKTDVVPGRSNRMSLEADHPGTFLGQCTEFCGLSHANMRLRAIAQTPADFNAWVEAQRRAATPPPPDSPAGEGMVLFNQKGCGGCHTVTGVSKGDLGPNLTHFHSRGTFAGSMFETNPQNLRRWLRDPPKVKPGSKMPNLNLTPDEIDQLVAYLETLS